MEIEKASVRAVESYCAAVAEVAAEGKWLSTDKGFSLLDSLSFMKYCATGKNVQLFLMDGEQVAGWCDVVSTYRAGEGSLGIGLRAAYRGMGWGGTLLDETLKIAQRRFNRLSLHVRADNGRAVAMYIKRGFKTKKRYKTGKYKNLNCPVLMMVKNVKKKD